MGVKGYTGQGAMVNICNPRTQEGGIATKSQTSSGCMMKPCLKQQQQDSGGCSMQQKQQQNYIYGKL